MEFIIRRYRYCDDFFPSSNMMKHSILLFTLLLIATGHLADANYCEGIFTTNIDEVLRETEAELEGRSRSSGVSKILKSIFPRDKGFKDICKECTPDEKLSICMKVLQHRLKKIKPTKFTVDLNESTLVCQYTMFYGRDSRGICNVYEQKMYVCPSTTVKYKRAGKKVTSEEPPFLIGQSLLSAQNQIRFCDCTSQPGAAVIQGQLTGFEMKAVEFERSPDGLYTYRPNYGDPESRESDSAASSSSRAASSSSPVAPSRPSIADFDYTFEREECQLQ